MSTFHINYLNGSISLPISKPSLLDDDLFEFYRNPNAEIYGSLFSRELIHESIHFWHFFSSGYLANLHGDFWSRMTKYEMSGELIPPSKQYEDFKIADESSGFSAYNLFECVTRFWDVHTRNPVTIINEDPALELSDSFENELGHYTSNAFDYVMSNGSHSKLYSQVYLWMLNEFNYDSRFVNSVFPSLAHCSFGTPSPIEALLKLVSEIKKVKGRSFIASLLTANIHANWFRIWQEVVPILNRILIDNGFPSYTSGIEVMERGVLKRHKLYEEYISRTNDLRKNIVAFAHTENRQMSEEERLERVVLKTDISALFCHPGHPTYRLFLGAYLQPPVLNFSDSKIIAAKGRDAFGLLREDDSLLEAYLNQLSIRTKQFSNVLKADSLNLPLDTFVDY